MNVDSPKRDLAGPLLDRLTGFWRPLRNLGAARSRVNGSRFLLTAAEFQEELAVLGLSGRRFEPEDYSDTLGEYLNISITVHVYRTPGTPSSRASWRSRDGLGNFDTRSS